MNKYRNHKVDGFDSKRERMVFNQLEALKAAAHPSVRVVDIRRQVKYELLPKQEGERAVYYVADFVVKYADGREEVIDAKGMKTRVYVLKRKLMLYRHGIKVREA